MSRARKRITNLINGDVVIEDLGLRLRGKSDSGEVSAAAAAASRDLPRHRRLVKVEDIGSPETMPFWPFIPSAPPPAPPPAPAPAPSEDLSEIRKSVAGIEAAMRSLLERPAPAPPEVLAAHLRTIQSLPGIPAGLPGAPNLPGPGASAEPMFIPSKIVPEGTGGDIKVREDEVEKGDMDDGVEALRRLRRK